MRDLVVRSHHKRLECISWVEAKRAAGRSRAAARIGFVFLDSVRVRRGRIIRRLGRRKKVNFARRTESGHNGRLQRRHVVTLDPELVNIIRNAKGQTALRRIGQLNGREPALESIGTYLRFEGRRQLLPQVSTILVHTELVNSVTQSPQRALAREIAVWKAERSLKLRGVSHR